MSNNFDVFICGSGSAGLCAATWLAKHGIKCKIVDSRDGPLVLGQADGVQCRTVEIYESFGISEEILREGQHILEVTFWGSEGDDGIVRKSRTFDTAPGLSHQPHIILNQARMNGLLLEQMRKHNGQEVDYGYKVVDVKVDAEAAKNPDSHAVTVKTERNGKEEIFHAKYVLACDGAHSAVRRSLGFQMVGDTSDAVWGVMDVYPRTNFPDYRKKVHMQTRNGDLLIIPREGGSLTRFYVELPAGTKAKKVKIGDLKATASKIFHPYKMEIADVYWWSAFAIGQRLCDHFQKDNRVFLTGDACHTHSPKAGQGMNTSLADGYNIGWKLASILRGQAHPDLIKTYELERGMTAADLIDFDRRWSEAFSSKNSQKEGNRNKLGELFAESAKYTAGLSVHYADSMITWSGRSSQDLATKLTVGMRFPSAQVVRFCDARAMQLAKALASDGRWRIVIFPGDVSEDHNMERLNKLGDFLASPEGPARRHTPEEEDIDSFIEPLVIFSGQRIKLEQSQIHPYFWPVTGKWAMRDLNKTFFDDESYNSGHGHAYDAFGVDSTKGALAIVRPDQYISAVLAIEDHVTISAFLEGFTLHA